ncbi:hypothetical protein F4677DRAFT_450808 [Hypoxylon crocopeplum]|nr:hypothetical protein F4677DRAFT_450808 [Hypoxylon crocopeplum]
MANNLSVGKLQAALASATNEVAVAAANINFDFALVKYDAPPEYQPLLQTLSSYRRAEAEGGSQHVTARKLGALFDGLCPSTPNLIGKFGKRAAEISRAAVENNQQKPTENWIFSEYTGVDSTSLWAAATSRQAALPVYLLACMLARAWSDADATSLWVEIVAERRREITTRFENGEPLPFALTAAVVQQEISREELAKWDASARAWLRTADAVKAKDRKQFLLIANNISIPVNSETRPFKSIIPAWISALGSMEKILIGAPHAVKDGSVLLGISAWHIYPDMIIFSTPTGSRRIDMKDDLVHPGGVVSLGLSDYEPRGSRGVYWSLSLANHRFYGRPIRKSSEVNGDGSRLTFAELQVVVMGAILSRWRVPQAETDNTLRFLMQLAAALPNNAASFDDRWIDMITKPIMDYFRNEESMAPLISLGRRRSEFIPANTRDQATEYVYFGLTRADILLNLAGSSEDRIDLLRRLAGRIEELKQTGALIGFLHNEEWHLATAFPIRIRDGKPLFTDTTERQDSSKAEQIQCRWLGKDDDFFHPSPSERVFPTGRLPFQRTRTRIILKDPSMTFSFLFGDADAAAVFVLDNDFNATSRIPSPPMSHDDIVWCLQYDLIRPQELKSYLEAINSPIIETLVVVGFASDIYSTLSSEGATISPRILTAPLGIHFIEKRLRDSTSEIDKRQLAEMLRQGLSPRWSALAIIAYFEIGKDIITVKYTDEDKILGLSSGDSIYVPSNLLHDPTVSCRPYHFNRLLGNLARPGLTILTSPEQPEVREIDLGSWRQAPGQFDGSQLDCFKSTSLHLSFTDWAIPLHHDSAVGQRDSEAAHVEAVISVRDAGCWVADINIVAALNNSDVYQLPEPLGTCNHLRPTEPPPHYISVETWDQILDCSEGVLVTRSFGNWVSRVAIVAVLAQHCRLRSKRIVICPQRMCWKCPKIPAHNIIFVY